MEGKVTKYIKRINELPLLTGEKINQLKIVEKGEDNIVFNINNKWIIRIPRQKVANSLNIEKKFLTAFINYSSIPVPEIMPNTPGIMIYKKIKGVLLTKKLYSSLSRKEKNNLAYQLGGFLTAIHSFPVSKARKMGVSTGWNNWKIRSYNIFKKSVAPYLSKKVSENSAGFLKNVINMKYKPSVIHGDFYPPDHIYYNPKLRKISGIIDFGDITIGDCTIDFTAIYNIFGKGFYNNVFRNYNLVTDSDFTQRVKFMSICMPIFEASFALIKNNKELLKKRLIIIDETFKKPYII